MPLKGLNAAKIQQLYALFSRVVFGMFNREDILDISTRFNGKINYMENISNSAVFQNFIRNDKVEKFSLSKTVLHFLILAGRVFVNNHWVNMG